MVGMRPALRLIFVTKTAFIPGCVTSIFLVSSLEITLVQIKALKAKSGSQSQKRCSPSPVPGIPSRRSFSWVPISFSILMACLYSL